MRYELIYKRKRVVKTKGFECLFDALGAAIAVLETEDGAVEGIKQDGEWVLKSGVANSIWMALGTVKGEYWREKAEETQADSEKTGEEKES